MGCLPGGQRRGLPGQMPVRLCAWAEWPRDVPFQEEVQSMSPVLAAVCMEAGKIGIRSARNHEKDKKEVTMKGLNRYKQTGKVRDYI